MEGDLSCIYAEFGVIYCILQLLRSNELSMIIVSALLVFFGGLFVLHS